MPKNQTSILSKMAITYSEHAKARMKQRGILKSEAEETILHPYFTVQSRLERFIAVNKYGEVFESHL